MTDGLVLLCAGAVLLVAAPALQWQFAQANDHLLMRSAAIRCLALAGVVLGALLGAAGVVLGVVSVAE